MSTASWRRMACVCSYADHLETFTFSTLYDKAAGRPRGQLIPESATIELQVKLYTAQHRLRRVSLGPHFGRQKRRAIREVNYSVRAATMTLRRDRA